ncbi:MAG: cytochrome P450 [Myxococcales bacterium]|nr:cytochrome P450 [Myxococcales bacterium]
MEQHAGIAWDQGLSAWRVTGHAAARRVLADPHLDVVRESTAAHTPLSGEPTPVEFLGSWFSRSPRDRHLAVKRRLVRVYGPAALEPSRAAMVTLAESLARALPDRCDLVADYLQPLVLGGVAQLLAVPSSEHPAFGRVVRALSAILGRPALDERALAVTARCMQYLRAFVERMRRVPQPPPLVAALRSLGGDDPQASPWPVAAALAQVLTAGLHPTVTGAAIAWRTLHERPAVRDQLAAGTLALGELVEEVLRLHPPFPFLRRWAHAPCECTGVTLAPGDAVVVDVGAVNRDPAVFEHPERILGGRARSLGLSFGHGGHRCLGPGLARLQVTVALRALLDLDRVPRPIAASASGGPVEHLLVVSSLPCEREPTSPALRGIA